MGEVHFARATEGPRAGQHVAIKRVLPSKLRDTEAVRLLLAEAETLNRLDHPNIVKAYEVGVFEGEPFIVMEALDGRDLRLIIRQCRQRRIFVPIDFACALFRTWLDALGSMHRASGKLGLPLNLVHRDISPHNLFIAHSGDIKLTDFGLSQPAGNVGAQRAWAQGKPTYLSPEALDGEVSVATDLWAVAVTLYELLCLEAPFQGDSFEALMKAIRTAKPASARTSRNPQRNIRPASALCPETTGSESPY
jgi:serine/threonine-protein kinase